MKPIQIAVTTTGSAGAATGSAEEATKAGRLLGLLIVRNGAPNTTDVTISEVINGVSRTLLTITDLAADRDDFPLVLGQDNTGADIAGQYTSQILFGGKLTVSVAQSNAGAPILTVIAIVEE